MQYVFIGGPSTGKTTIIDQMHKRGFVTISETARKLLEDNSVAKPTVDRHAFQQEVFRQQLQAEERTLHLDGPCFLDGGVFDGCAYYLCDEMEVPSNYDTINGLRYECAFLFEELEHFVSDGVRYQDRALSVRISALLQKVYLDRGVKVVRVPNFSVEARTELLLQLTSSCAK